MLLRLNVSFIKDRCTRKGYTVYVENAMTVLDEYVVC